jgi:hypothetical protein
MFPSPVSAMKSTIRQAGTRINAPKNLRGPKSFRMIAPEESLLDSSLLNAPPLNLVTHILLGGSLLYSHFSSMTRSGKHPNQNIC